MKFYIPVIAAAILASASVASGATFDAFSSFNGTQGAGHFYYGTVPNSGGAGTPFTNNANCVVPGSTCLQSNGNNVPGFYKNTGTPFHFLTVDVPNDRLLAHPGATDRVFATFFAPTTDSYAFHIEFNILDVTPTGVALGAYSITNGVIAGTSLGTLTAPKQSRTLNFTRTLQVGDGIGIVIDSFGNYFNDSTGLVFHVSSAVPEPSSWVMMIAGFGLIGAAMRRRGRVVLAQT